MITNEADLASAILNAKDGDVISTSGKVVVSKPLPEVKHRITFDKCVLIYIHRSKSVETIQPMLTLKENCEFIWCDMYGNRVNPTTWQQDGLQCLVKADGADYVRFLVTGLMGSNYAAIWAYDCDMMVVEDSSIINNVTEKQDYGFGYGIWQGGRGDAIVQQLIVQDCEFSNNRHHIAGSYHPNDMTIQRCEFSSNEFCKQMIDRHGREGKGGRNLTVTDCIFHNENSYAYDLAEHSGKVSFYGNTFARAKGRNGRVGGKVVDFNCNQVKDDG